MDTRLSNALLVSLFLHGLAVAAILFSAYAFRNDEVNTKIIELVAGEGDNYGATVAPALGDPDSTKNSPLTEAPPASQQTIQAVAAPQEVAPKPTTRTPDFSRTITRVSDRVVKREMTKFEKQQKEEADRQAKLAAEREKEEQRRAAATMTKEEFDKKYGKNANPSARSGAGQVKISRLDTKGIAGGVVGGSTENMKGGAGGKALSREEGDLLDAYFSKLIQRLREAHERPMGVSDLLSAKAEFTITQEGTILNPHIVRSSGNEEFDQSVLSAFRNVGSIGPRPDNGGTMTKQVVFKMRDE